MATTLSGYGRHARDDRAGSAVALPRTRNWSISLSTVGLLALILAAWAGIIPFVGPIFGYDATGTGSWAWTSAHGWLALAPGAVGVLMALWLMGRVPSDSIGARRASLAISGTILAACGAWLVIGPMAWPVISSSPHYFVAAAPLRNLLNHLGYSYGPGLILAACGAFAFGWAARHDLPLGTGAAMRDLAGAEVPVAPAAQPVVAPAPAEPVMATRVPAGTAPVAPATPDGAAPVDGDPIVTRDPASGEPVVESQSVYR